MLPLGIRTTTGELVATVAKRTIADADHAVAVLPRRRLPSWMADGAARPSPNAQLCCGLTIVPWNIPLLLALNLVTCDGEDVGAHLVVTPMFERSDSPVRPRSASRS